jgi:membrane associated rhomboid family serine protease
VPASLGLVLALMLAMSVWAWLDRTRSFMALVALSPEAVLQGQLWRLVSWPFVMQDPLDLAFAGILLYGLGQQLAFAWSERRFLSRFFGYAAFATVGTTVVAWFAPELVRPHVGAWPIVNAFVVSWGLLYPDRHVNLFFVLPISGRIAAWLMLGGTVLYGIARGGLPGVVAFAPHLFAIGAAWMLATGVGVRRPWRDARAWLAEQSARRRARHLKVVKRNGEEDRPRWLN